MKSLVEQQREHFNDISAQYWEARKHPNHLLLKDLIWSNFFSGKQNLSRNQIRVLEPMCGMSEGLQILKRHLKTNIDYSGFDYSEEMVEIARKLYPTERIEWRDATTYSNQGEPFDWIILIGGLHHVFSKSSEVVERLSSALKPGGHFLSFEPTQNCFITRIMRQGIYKRNQIFDEQSEQGFDLSSLDNIFERAGFEKEDQIFPGLLAYILYYNPDAFPYLNIGGERGVRTVFFFDRLLWRTWLAKKLSFATITLWRKRK